MTFQVEPAALRTYGRQLGGDAQDADAAGSYIRKYATFGWHQEGMINKLHEAHDTFVGEVSAALAHLKESLEKASAQMSAAASYYEHTDATAAGRIDASYPATARPSLLDQ